MKGYRDNAQPAAHFSRHPPVLSSVIGEGHYLTLVRTCPQGCPTDSAEGMLRDLAALSARRLTLWGQRISLPIDTDKAEAMLMQHSTQLSTLSRPLSTL
jgi:hypothetical protein